MNALYLPTDHPWYFLHQFGAPNVKWCEQTLHGWITEPANTWSNLAYILIGLIIFRSARQSKSPFLRYFPYAAIFLGFASGIYHASSTFILQILDFTGMYVVFLLPVLINLRRMGTISDSQGKRAYVATVLGATLLVPVVHALGLPIQAIILLIVLGTIATEITAANRSPANHGNFYRALGCLGIAGVASSLDVTRAVCVPEQHYLHGHTVWHLFTAITIYFAFRHYRQFDSDVSTPVQKVNPLETFRIGITR